MLPCVSVFHMSVLACLSLLCFQKFHLLALIESSPIWNQACIGQVESNFFEGVSCQDSSHFQLIDQLMIFLLYLVGYLQVKIHSISISSWQVILDSLAFFESTLRFVVQHLH